MGSVGFGASSLALRAGPLSAVPPPKAPRSARRALWFRSSPTGAHRHRHQCVLPRGSPVGSGGHRAECAVAHVPSPTLDPTSRLRVTDKRRCHDRHSSRPLVDVSRREQIWMPCRWKSAFLVDRFGLPPPRLQESPTPLRHSWPVRPREECHRQAIIPKPPDLLVHK